MSTTDSIPASTVPARGASSIRIKLSRDDYALRTGLVVVISLLAILVEAGIESAVLISFPGKP